MDESDDKTDNSEAVQKSGDHIKRLKMEDSGLGKSEQSSTSSSNTEQESAGSSDNNHTTCNAEPVFETFKNKSKSKSRNYRNSREGDANDSEDQADSNAVDHVEDVQRPIEEVERGTEDDNEWEDFAEVDEDDEDIDDEDDMILPDAEGSDTSGFEGNVFSDEADSDDSNSTVTHDTENEFDITDHPIFKKEKPKHQWFAIPELDKRQLGFSAKLQSRELFQRRCYGSLNSVLRLELMYKLEEHAGCVNSLNFHPNGSLLASGSDDLKVCIWDWKLGKLLMKYKTRHRGNIFQSKFLHLSGDLHVASCARDGQVRLAELSKEEGVRNARLLGSHKGPCHKLIVLPEQPHVILSAGEDGVVLSHDVREPKSTTLVKVRDDSKEVSLYSIHGHPLKTHEFCVSGRDAFVRVYDQRKASKPIACYTPFKSKNKFRNHHVTCAVYNYNGSEILASYSDADIYLFDVNGSEPGKYVHEYQGHKNVATIKGVNFFGPKSEFIVSGSDCGHIYFWEKNTESLVQWLLADENGVVNCLEPHPQLPFIATSGLDWDVKVWVPSCTDEPNMLSLAETVKSNLQSKFSESDASDINESQMLWMLWRHLRNNSRLRVHNVLNVRDFMRAYSDPRSSSSDSASSSEDSDDALDRAPNCSTS